MLISGALWGVVVPAAIAGFVLFATARRQGTGGVPLAFGAAYGAASLGLHQGMAGGPEGRLLVVAVGATILGFVEGRWTLPAWGRRGLQVCTGAAAAALLAQPLVAPQGWGVFDVGWRIAVVTAAILVAWLTIGELTERERGASLAAGLALLAACSAVVVTLAGMASAGQLAGAIAAALGAAVLALWRRAASLQGGAPVLALGIVGHLSAGLLYGEMPLTSFLLLSMAPLALLAARFPGMHRATAGIAAVAVRLVAVGVLSSAAVGISAQAYFVGSRAAPSGAQAGFDDDYGY